MRTIKFRGKSIETDEWIYGDLQQCEHAGEWIQPSEYFLADKVREGTVGQYVGRLDINGIEIFEGDIVMLERAYCACIVFKNEAFMCQWVKSNRKTRLGVCKTVEIIGNIHDNPELLKPE